MNEREHPDISEVCQEHCGGYVAVCRKGLNGLDNTPVELRGNIERWKADVLDAEAIACDGSRMDLVNKIIEEWALKRLHAATLLSRITRRNGSAAESAGSDGER